MSRRRSLDLRNVTLPLGATAFGESPGDDVEDDDDSLDDRRGRRDSNSRKEGNYPNDSSSEEESFGEFHSGSDSGTAEQGDTDKE